MTRSAADGVKFTVFTGDKGGLEVAQFYDTPVKPAVNTWKKLQGLAKVAGGPTDETGGESIVCTLAFAEPH